jgi:hypothetical protein
MYPSLNDPAFQRQLSLKDAYRILEAFVIQYHARGESSTVDLMTDVGVLPDGTSTDPAQVADFLQVAERLLPRAT